jgi:hypothetical protein
LIISEIKAFLLVLIGGRHRLQSPQGIMDNFSLQGIRQNVHSALLQFESLMIVVASILFHHCFVEIHILGGDGDW